MMGQWSIQDRCNGRVRLQLHANARSNGLASVSAQLALTEFQGLTEEQLGSSERVNFQLVREAGTFSFSGSFRKRAGTGEWTLNPAPDFLALLHEYGYAEPTNRDLFALTASDVNAAYIASIRAAGYHSISLKELVALRSNGVDREFIEQLQKRGQKNLSAIRLLSLRTNGF